MFGFGSSSKAETPKTGGGIFDSGAGLVGGILSGAANIANAYTSYQAYQTQKNQYADQKNREDSAVQRRVADLLAAGLSPVLAAGSAATTAAPPTPLERKIGDPSDSIMKALGILTQEKTIDQTVAQTELNKANKIKSQADAFASLQEGKIKEHDLGIYKKTGMPSNASGLGKTARDIISGGGEIVGAAAQKIDAKVKEARAVKDHQLINNMRQNKKSGFVGTKG